LSARRGRVARRNASVCVDQIDAPEHRQGWPENRRGDCYSSRAAAGGAGALSPTRLQTGCERNRGTMAFDSRLPGGEVPQIPRPDGSPACIVPRPMDAPVLRPVGATASTATACGRVSGRPHPVGEREPCPPSDPWTGHLASDNAPFGRQSAVAACSATPTSCMYAAYASPSSTQTAPRQILTIVPGGGRACRGFGPFRSFMTLNSRGPPGVTNAAISSAASALWVSSRRCPTS
jgi:hypothetical protein